MKTMLAGVSLLALFTPALAQVASPRLSIPDAGHVLAPPRQPPATAPRQPSLAPQADLPASQTGRLRFDHVRLVGAAHLAAADIAAQFAPLQNRQIGAEELKPVLDRINAMYAAAGFPLGRAFVPAQRIRNGELVVHLVEGFVARLAVQTGDTRLKQRLERIGARLTQEKPLTRATLERVLLLMQDLPGITLGSQFTDMNPQTGATTLLISASVKPVTLGFALSNRANLGSLPVQPYAIATLNNLLGAGEQIVLTTLVSPNQDENAFYGLSVTAPLDHSGLSVGLDASWAQALDEISLRPFQVRSRSTQLGAKLRYAAIRATDENLSTQGRVYFTRAAYSLASMPVTLAHDQFVAAELSADYTRAFSSDLGLGASTSLTQGLTSLTGEPHTRVATIPGFTKALGQARLVWQPVEAVTLNLSALAQYSPDALAASEQVAFGGLNYGRGFNISEITGDSGLGLSFQPQYRIKLDESWSISPFLAGEYARTFNHHRNVQPDAELVSAGGGLKLGISGIADVTLEMDKPLNRTPFGRSDRDWRFFAGVELGLDKLLGLIGQSR